MYVPFKKSPAALTGSTKFIIIPTLPSRCIFGGKKYLHFPQKSPAALTGIHSHNFDFAPRILTTCPPLLECRSLQGGKWLEILVMQNHNILSE